MEDKESLSDDLARDLQKYEEARAAYLAAKESYDQVVREYWKRFAEIDGAYHLPTLTTGPGDEERKARREAARAALRAEFRPRMNRQQSEVAHLWRGQHRALAEASHPFLRWLAELIIGEFEQQVYVVLEAKAFTTRALYELAIEHDWCSEFEEQIDNAVASGLLEPLHRALGISPELLKQLERWSWRAGRNWEVPSRRLVADVISFMRLADKPSLSESDIEALRTSLRLL